MPRDMATFRWLFSLASVGSSGGLVLAAVIFSTGCLGPHSGFPSPPNLPCGEMFVAFEDERDERKKKEGGTEKER